MKWGILASGLTLAFAGAQSCTYGTYDGSYDAGVIEGGAQTQTFTIGPEKEFDIALADGSLGVHVPAGAANGPTTFTIRTLSALTPSGAPVWQFSPPVTFSRDVTVYAKAPNGMTTNTLALATADGGGGTPSGPFNATLNPMSLVASTANMVFGEAHNLSYVSLVTNVSGLSPCTTKPSCLGCCSSVSHVTNAGPAIVACMINGTRSNGEVFGCLEGCPQSVMSECSNQPPASVHCGQVECLAPQICWMSPDGPPQCRDQSLPNPDGKSRDFHCDGPEDCSGQMPVCCYTERPANGGGGAATICVGQGACPADHTMCTGGNGCPGGSACAAACNGISGCFQNGKTAVKCE